MSHQHRDPGRSGAIPGTPAPGGSSSRWADSSHAIPRYLSEMIEITDHTAYFNARRLGLGWSDWALGQGFWSERRHHVTARQCGRLFARARRGSTDRVRKGVCCQADSSVDLDVSEPESRRARVRQGSSTVCAYVGGNRVAGARAAGVAVRPLRLSAWVGRNFDDGRGHCRRGSIGTVPTSLLITTSHVTIELDRRVKDPASRLAGRTAIVRATTP